MTSLYELDDFESDAGHLPTPILPTSTQLAEARTIDTVYSVVIAVDRSLLPPKLDIHSFEGPHQHYDANVRTPRQRQARTSHGARNNLYNYSDREVRTRIYESFLRALQSGHDPNTVMPLQETQLVREFFPPVVKNQKVSLIALAFRQSLLISKMMDNFILGLHHGLDPNEESVMTQAELVLFFFPPIMSRPMVNLRGKCQGSCPRDRKSEM